ncbi:Arylsulfatase [Cytospora mali]|uniref:Arylsulfatase n=1 Tax=Cytospora mali TaxID=578113 RepID=A0A194VK68_CYTMA|nr:Arylsulfatase [Valsa mali]
MASKKTFKNGYGTFSGVSELFAMKKSAEPTSSPDSSSANASAEDSPQSSPSPAVADNPAGKQSRLCTRPLSRKAWILLIIMFSSVILAVGLLAGLLTREGHAKSASGRPNIVFIMADDQDRLLNSTDYMPALQRELFAKGTEFTHHYTTQALCCPSRSSILRGQQTHNTNITNVVAPGGAYNKWVLSGQDKDYLPHWLKAAGYRTEYVGKIMNGYGLSNYKETVKGWDYVDAVLEPYIDDYNSPVFSTNSGPPIYYEGFHQTDITRIKALHRLDYVTNQSEPFFMAITPFTPHIAYQQNKPSHRPIPLKRHFDLFPNVKVPQPPNFNPADQYQEGKSGWVKWLAPMNESAIDFADFVYRSRLQALYGVDEIVNDVVAMLEEKGVADNTYIIYTSDNGYHLGQHRVPGGKSLFYNEDVNIPFIVRGPNVPQGVSSSIPGLHLDLAPTFLEIAGLPKSKWPGFFDGRSLLDQWHQPLNYNVTAPGQGNNKESINIEYWGLVGIEAPSAASLGAPFYNNTYKTIRTIGDEQNWAYAVWCNGHTELYNVSADPYELTNLARAYGGNTVSTEAQRVVNRLNALLMVTKSCEQDRCREPWSWLKPDDSTTLVSLAQAMDPAYDDFFANFQKVKFDTCLSVQKAENEGPYFPELDTLAGGGLGRAYRNATDVISGAPGARVITTSNYYGTEDQRHATLEDIRASSRFLTQAELTAT